MSRRTPSNRGVIPYGNSNDQQGSPINGSRRLQIADDRDNSTSALHNEQSRMNGGGRQGYHSYANGGGGGISSLSTTRRAHRTTDHIVATSTPQSAMRTTLTLILGIIVLIVILLTVVTTDDDSANTKKDSSFAYNEKGGMSGGIIGGSDNTGDWRKSQQQQQQGHHRYSYRRMRTDVASVLDTDMWQVIHSPRTNNYLLNIDEPLDTDPKAWLTKSHARPLDTEKNQHRVAIVIPYISPQDGAPAFPAYFEAFCAAAGGSASLVDFIIVHDGIPKSLVPYENIPPNVKLVNLGSTVEMANLFLRVLDDPNNVMNSRRSQLSKTQTAQLVKMVSLQLHRYPYLLVEFKPALGHIFQEYLDPTIYSHWGYSDLDILFGDLPRWITSDELNDYDVVTYGYGDQARLYIRGQFTFHKNDPAKINQLWRPCHFLSKLDERMENARTGKEKLKFQSAEGCYSSKIIQTLDIKVKYVPKAFTDVTNDLASVSDVTLLGDLHYTHGLYLGLGTKASVTSQNNIDQQRNKYNSSHPRKTVVYRASSDDPEDAVALLEQPMNWFETHNVYSNPDIPLLRPEKGDGDEKSLLIPIKTLLEQGYDAKDIHCMYWAPANYQKHICVDPEEVTSHDTVYLINGKLFKQRHVIESFFDGKIQTGPFFHFQEWKRYYRPAQLSTLKYSHITGAAVATDATAPATIAPERVPMVEGWVITKEGALPVYPPTHSGHLEDIDPLITGTDKETSSNKKKHIARAGSTQYHGLKGVVLTHIVTHWMEAERVDRNHLPPSSHMYCLRSSKQAFPPHPEVSHCDDAISWQDRSRVVILNEAPSWDSLHNQGEQITMVLTLQLSKYDQYFDPENEEGNAKVLDRLLQLAEDNILSWDNSSSGSRQPCILLIHVAGVTEKIVTQIYEKFGSRSLTLRHTSKRNRIKNEEYGDDPSVMNDPSADNNVLVPKQKNHHFSHCLVAAIFSQDDKPVSRKALLNMAREAAPTRWVVSGLELERGLVVNKEASLFAHRAVKVQGDVPGKAFLIPQFAAVRNIHAQHPQHDKGSKEHESKVATTVGIMDVVHMKREHKLMLTNDLSTVDCVPCRDEDNAGDASKQSEIEQGIQKHIEELWWEMTAARIPSFSGISKQEIREEVEWSKSLEDLSYMLIDLLSPENQDSLETFDVSPLILVDRIGPKKRMFTLSVVKEIEEFGGSKCFAALSLAHLAALGYDLHVLPGAFALSLPVWRDALLPGTQTCREKREHLSLQEESESLRCAGCYMMTEHIKNAIAKDERGRAAKAALLWHDLDESRNS